MISMLIPLESNDGKLRLVDDENEYSIIFTNAGFLSNNLILYGYQHRENRRRLNAYNSRIVICKNDVTQDNILSVIAESNRLNSKYIGLNSTVTVIGESFSNIESWLPKFVHEYYSDDIMINNLKIYIGFTKFNFKEIKTANEEINSKIIYPFKDLWHHEALRKLLIADHECINRLIVCENPKSEKKFCTECPTCKKLKFDLQMIYAEYPEDTLIVNRCKSFYKEIFNENLKRMQAGYNSSGPILIDTSNYVNPKIKPITKMMRNKSTNNNTNEGK